MYGECEIYYQNTLKRKILNKIGDFNGKNNNKKQENERQYKSCLHTTKND